MISRRKVLGMAACLAPACLPAQDAQRQVFWVKLSFTVTDSHNRYIAGLRPTDFHIVEDRILQKISTFAEGTKPPLYVNADGTTKPIGNAKVTESGKLGLDLVREDGDLENSYIITYYPDRSNHNEGFRSIRIEIIPDEAKRWRVKSRPGYRPKDILESQEH